MTDEQLAVVDAVRSCSRVKVEALAGTGKTRTLVEVARTLSDVNPNQRTLYTAFNRGVVEDVRHAIGSVATARTVHSLALESLGPQFGRKLRESPTRIEPGTEMARLGIPKNWKLTLNRVDGEARVLEAVPIEINWTRTLKHVRESVRGFTRSADRTLDLSHVPETDKFNLPRGISGEFELPVEYRAKVLQFAEKLWSEISNPTSNRFPFKHDHYLKLWQLTDPKLPFDSILFDEAQDADPIMRAVIESHQGQIVWCGDRNQAIYGWRGAINALQLTNADVTLYLTQSFRFGPAIAEVANSFLVPLGSPLVRGLDSVNSIVGKIPRPDVELFRSNVMLLLRFLEIVNSGRKVNVSADLDDLGQIIDAFMQLENHRQPTQVGFENFSSLEEFRKWLWDREIEDDQFRTMAKLVDRLRSVSSLASVRAAIRRAMVTRGSNFAAGGVLLTTPHKVKGMEFESVKIANDFPAFDPYSATETYLSRILLQSDRRWTTPSEEEWNLAYVAVTRAQFRLDHPFYSLQRKGYVYEGQIRERRESSDQIRVIGGIASRRLMTSSSCDYEVLIDETKMRKLIERVGVDEIAKRQVGRIRHAPGLNPLRVQVELLDEDIGQLNPEDFLAVATLLNGDKFEVPVEVVSTKKSGMSEFSARIGLSWTMADTHQDTTKEMLNSNEDRPDLPWDELDPGVIELMLDKFGQIL